MNIARQALAALALGMAAFAGFQSCSDDDSVEASVGISPKKIIFGNKAETKELVINTNIEMTLTPADEWCTVELTSQQNSNLNGGSIIARYAVTVQDNADADDRTTTIAVAGKGFSDVVTVTQTKADAISIDPATLACPQAGTTASVAVTANGEVTCESTATWIRVQSLADGVATVAVSANYTTAERTGSVVFSCGNASATLAVTQEAYNSSDVPTDGLGNTPAEVVASLGLGWNLGNQFDAHNGTVSSETSWGNGAVTAATFEAVRAAGFKTVRIPITWLGHVGDAPDYTIDSAWLDRIAEVVGMAEAAGLNVIINIHHDGADSKYWLNIKQAATDEAVNATVTAQLTAMWTQIANRFADKGSFLLFESVNEIHDGGWGWGSNRNDGGKQYAVLNGWNQAFVDAVRATGGNNLSRHLCVPGYCTNPDLTLNHFELPTDVVAHRLLVAVHYYDPYEYTLNCVYSQWGHTAASGTKAGYGDEAYMRDVFGKLKAKFVDAGIPVYLGEVGCVHRATTTDEAFRKYYLEYLCKAAADYQLSPVYWDNGSAGAGKECSGLFNHATGAWLNNAEEVVAVMTRGFYTTSADYTLQTVYDSAPQP